jgi:hypothetical protein
MTNTGHYLWHFACSARRRCSSTEWRDPAGLLAGWDKPAFGVTHGSLYSPLSWKGRQRPWLAFCPHRRDYRTCLGMEEEVSIRSLFRQFSAVLFSLAGGLRGFPSLARSGYQAIFTASAMTHLPIGHPVDPALQSLSPPELQRVSSASGVDRLLSCLYYIYFLGGR